MNLIDMCTNPYILRLLYILVAVLKLVCIIVPIIIMARPWYKLDKEGEALHLPFTL